jgi:hypothetical protein
MLKHVADMFALVRRPNDEIAKELKQFDTILIEKAIAALNKPIQLTFAQRLIARPFCVDVDKERRRFLPMLRQELKNRL